MKKPHFYELLICRSLLDDEVLQCLAAYLEQPANVRMQYEFASRLIDAAEELGLKGNLLRAYILYRLANNDNIAARSVESTKGHISSSLRDAFIHDIEVLEPLLREPPSAFLTFTMLDDYRPGSPSMTPGIAALQGLLERPWTPAKLADALTEYYLRIGCGNISAYRAFRWDEQSGLVGIRHFEPVRFTDLIGYMDQKKELQSNTLAFLAGRPANNVLLVGARGTGKSSSVKALANEYFNMGLRLVQITKPQLTALPRLMDELRRFASKHFIVFLDDLSFEETEPEYKYLKSTIEGGVESRPENVLIYATSNRRHLIKETWRDRDAGKDELYKADSMNETISLSDRFGLIINYRSPNQNEYLAIIDHHLRANGVILPPEELRILGQRWELEHSGRNGRTAQQFVTHYLGQMKDEKTKLKTE